MAGITNINGIDEFQSLVDNLVAKGATPSNAAAKAREMLAAQGKKAAKGIKAGNIVPPKADAFVPKNNVDFKEAAKLTEKDYLKGLKGKDRSYWKKVFQDMGLIPKSKADLQAEAKLAKEAAAKVAKAESAAAAHVRKLNGTEGTAFKKATHLKKYSKGTFKVSKNGRKVLKETLSKADKKALLKGTTARADVMKSINAASTSAADVAARESARVAKDTSRMQALKPYVDRLRNWYNNLGQTTTTGGAEAGGVLSRVGKFIGKHKLATAVAAVVVVGGAIMASKSKGNNEAKFNQAA